MTAKIALLGKKNRSEEAKKSVVVVGRPSNSARTKEAILVALLLIILLPVVHSLIIPRPLLVAPPPVSRWRFGCTSSSSSSSIDGAGSGSSSFPAARGSRSRRATAMMASPAAAGLQELLDDGPFLDEVLKVAVAASKRAGKIILENHGDGDGDSMQQGVDVSERKANSRDLLTLIDPMCEAAIKATVLKAFPSHDFLGEEDVPPGKEASAAALEAKLGANLTKAEAAAEGGGGASARDNLLWIVDPIDGTYCCCEIYLRTCVDIE